PGDLPAERGGKFFEGARRDAGPDGPFRRPERPAADPPRVHGRRLPGAGAGEERGDAGPPGGARQPPRPASAPNGKVTPVKKFSAAMLLLLPAAAWAAGASLPTGAAGIPASAAAAQPLPPETAARSVVLKERPVRLPPFFWYENDPEARSRLLMAG